MVIVERLFINAAILIAFISVIYQIYHTNTPHSFSQKLARGFLFALLGITLIQYSVSLSNGLILDFRALPVIVAALNGGPVTALSAALIISFYRLLRFGISAGSILSSAALLVICAVVLFISKLNLKLWKKWLISVSFAELAVVTLYTVMISDTTLKLEYSLLYVVILTLLSIFMYYYVNYHIAHTEAYQKYRHDAHKDFLTGLNNTRRFDALYNFALSHAYESGGNLALVFIDIDFFKRINDQYGHNEGDVILKQLGELLLKHSRSIDVVSRNGGEEFSIIITDTQPRVVFEIAERIRKAVEAYPFVLSDGTTIHLTISIGIAAYSDTLSDLSVLKEKADEALYTAKRSGRNKTVLI